MGNNPQIQLIEEYISSQFDMESIDIGYLEKKILEIGNHSYLHLMKIVLLAIDSKIEEAHNLIETIDPNSLDYFRDHEEQYMLALGWVNLRTSYYKEANEYLNRALAINGYNIWALFGKYHLYVSLSNISMGEKSRLQEFENQYNLEYDLLTNPYQLLVNVLNIKSRFKFAEEVLNKMMDGVESGLGDIEIIRYVLKQINQDNMTPLMIDFSNRL